MASKEPNGNPTFRNESQGGSRQSDPAPTLLPSALPKIPLRTPRESCPGPISHMPPLPFTPPLAISPRSSVTSLSDRGPSRSLRRSSDDSSYSISMAGLRKDSVMSIGRNMGKRERGRLLEKMIASQSPTSIRLWTPVQIHGTSPRKLELVEREIRRRRNVEEELQLKEKRKSERQRLADKQPSPGDKIWKGMKGLKLAERIAEEKQSAEMQHRLNEHSVSSLSMPTRHRASTLSTPPRTRDHSATRYETPSPRSFRSSISCFIKVGTPPSVIKETRSEQLGSPSVSNTTTISNTTTNASALDTMVANQSGRLKEKVLDR
ncbi:hypothetical protein BU16DRAFT_26491 [Lophium mytilinum]|uniref:Uncharacterized protein n=1 Tax=Lophium mytilinum TaxID=390894 RepID=A0A6A6REX3_9PEZI|nr:hypothetical protein BU16DRAFT_26491 [Lophium mytilinum]